MSNSLDPDQAQQNQNCLQTLSVDNACFHISKQKFNTLVNSVHVNLPDMLKSMAIVCMEQYGNSLHGFIANSLLS